MAARMPSTSEACSTSLQAATRAAAKRWHEQHSSLPIPQGHAAPPAQSPPAYAVLCIQSETINTTNLEVQQAASRTSGECAHPSFSPASSTSSCSAAASAGGSAHSALLRRPSCRRLPRYGPPAGEQESKCTGRPVRSCSSAAAGQGAPAVAGTSTAPHPMFLPAACAPQQCSLGMPLPQAPSWLIWLANMAGWPS